ncbi:MAG: 2-dehydropantoate 2-reductase [Clostridia bacterium]|nr:2-dehydropantoate 2-reductase [Clostridia bacterium]
MKITVVGLGGVGGFVGGALARVQPQTCFLTRGAALSVIREEGLRVRSDRLGEFCVVPILATDDAAEIGVSDAVIVAVKGYDLEETCRQIAPLIAPRTVVLPLLNGVLVSRLMEPLLPPCILADGCINVFSQIEAPGVVRQEGALCRIALGMRDGEMPFELPNLALVLENAGLRTELTKDIKTESWKKCMIMCGNSVALAYYNGPAGEIQKDPERIRFLRSAYEEIRAVAAADGVNLEPETVEQCMESFMRMPPHGTSSLYRDLAAGKSKTELFHVIGGVVELGKERGVPTPCHEAALQRWAPQFEAGK